MRVLFIAGACPYPPNSGGTLRTYNLLKQLCARHEITLVSPCAPGVDLHAAFDTRLCRLISIDDVPLGVVGKLASLFSPLPYIVKAHENPALNVAVEQALSSDDFDLVHCDSISVVKSIPSQDQIPTVFNSHNVEAVIWERYLENERRIWMRPILRSQLAKVSSYESLLPEMFDCCVAVSENDRFEMQRRYGAGCVVVVPNGVDLEYYCSIPDSDKPELLYVGSLDWTPNQDAVRWLIESIMPRVRLAIPNAHLSIVGRKPPSWMRSLCDKCAVTLYADVPDVRPYLADSSLVVVPLRIGGGSRLKILEAMAAGRCVVSTSIGAEGLELSAGHEIVIADDPADFARECISLLVDPIRRQLVAASGRTKVESEYGWDGVAHDMEHAWERALRRFEVLEARG